MRAHPMVGDSLIAALVLLFDIGLYVSASTQPWRHPAPWFVTLPLDLAIVLPLVFRRRRPIWAAYLTLLVSIPHSALELGIGSLATTTIAVYTLVVYTSRRVAGIYLAVLLVASETQIGIESSDRFWLDTLATVGITAFAWVLGEFVDARRAYHRELEARLELLETERDHAAMMAVAQERGRIARELHDIVAHAVSVIVVQADGASYAVRADPELAERAVHTISETGRAALAELRRLLEVLRNEDTAGEPRVPQPGADALLELADRVRAAGLRVRVELDGELTGLPAGVSLGIYRIVQEALTNTLKHAGSGAIAEVSVRREDDVVRVQVSDDGAGRARQLVPTGETTDLPGGNGVIGMRERANVFGGQLEIGPKPGGGWLVRATFPAGSER